MATEIIDISGSNFVRVENTSLSRKLPFGTDWTKISIGMRFCWENIGTDTVPTTPSREGFMGVCAGDRWPVGRVAPIHALGTTIIPFRGTEGDPHRLQMAESQWLSIIGSSKTYAASLSRWWIQSIAYLPADNGVTTAAWILHITKSSTWTINLISKANSSGEDIPPEISLDTFRQAMITSDATTVGTLIGGSSRARSVTIDENANGYFDTFSFFWPLSTPSLFISEFAIVKLS